MKKLGLLLGLCLSTNIFAEQYFVQWVVKPRINFSPILIEDVSEFNPEIAFITDDIGKIIKVDMLKSSGSIVFDNQLKASFLQARLAPYQENGQYIPIKGIQSIIIEKPKYIEKTVSYYNCTYTFSSDIYDKQTTFGERKSALKALPFIYKEKPVVEFVVRTQNQSIEPENFEVSILYKMNRKIEGVFLTQKTENRKLNIAVQNAIWRAGIESKKMFWREDNFDFQDKIQLKQDKCELVTESYKVYR